MKKIVLSLLFAIILIGIFSQSNVVYATDTKQDFLENTYEMIDEIDTSKLDEIFTNNIYYQSIKGESFKDKLKSLISQDYQEENFFKFISKIFFINLNKFLPFFIILFIIAVLSGMIETIKPDGKAMQMSNVIFLACYLICISILLGQFIKTTTEVGDIVKNLSSIMQVLMPIILSLMAVSGMSSSVTLYRPIVVLLSNSLMSFISGILLPLVTGITIINLITNITEKIKFNKLREVLSTIFKWIIGITLTIFSLFLSVKGIYSSRQDGISLSAIKYLTGQVPVVGGFLKEGTDIFLASTTLIKNGLGKMGVFILFWELFSPALSILIVIFGINIIAGISEPFADSKIVNCYSSIAKSFSNLLAIILMAGFMFILTLILLITSGNVL